MSQVSIVPGQDVERGWVGGPEKKEVRSNRQIIHEEMLEKEEGGGCLRCCLVSPLPS